MVGEHNLVFQRLMGGSNQCYIWHVEGVQDLPEEWNNVIWKSIKGRYLSFQAKNGARYLDGNLRRGAKGYITTE